jgi:hypothetical protein
LYEPKILIVWKYRDIIYNMDVYVDSKIYVRIYVINNVAHKINLRIIIILACLCLRTDIRPDGYFGRILWLSVIKIYGRIMTNSNIYHISSLIIIIIRTSKNHILLWMTYMMRYRITWTARSRLLRQRVHSLSSRDNEFCRIELCRRLRDKCQWLGFRNAPLQLQCFRPSVHHAIYFWDNSLCARRTSSSSNEL